MNPKTSHEISSEIITELKSTLDQVDPVVLERLVSEISAARRIFCLGAGRSGFLLQAFCMRLNHLGLNAYMAGGLPCPPVEAGDLIVAASGSGSTQSVTTVLEQGRAAGARVALFTARDAKVPPLYADLTVYVPAPSSLVNRQNGSSQQPMRTLFEQAFFLICESIICCLKERKGIGEEDMARRHANLE